MNNPTRPEVEKLITYIEDEFCKRMDIDDFDKFFTELAIALMHNYGPSIPGNFGDKRLACGLYVESGKEKPAPARPEAVQEAMELFLATEPFGPSELRLYEAGKDLSAYVRELEADRDRLQAELAEARKGRG